MPIYYCRHEDDFWLIETEQPLTVFDLIKDTQTMLICMSYTTEYLCRGGEPDREATYPVVRVLKNMLNKRLPEFEYSTKDKTTAEILADLEADCYELKLPEPLALAFLRMNRDMLTVWDIAKLGDEMPPDEMVELAKILKDDNFIDQHHFKSENELVKEWSRNKSSETWNRCIRYDSNSMLYEKFRNHKYMNDETAYKEISAWKDGFDKAKEYFAKQEELKQANFASIGRINAMFEVETNQFLADMWKEIGQLKKDTNEEIARFKEENAKLFDDISKDKGKEKEVEAN